MTLGKSSKQMEPTMPPMAVAAATKAQPSEPDSASQAPPTALVRRRSSRRACIVNRPSEILQVAHGLAPHRGGKEQRQVGLLSLLSAGNSQPRERERGHEPE